MKYSDTTAVIEATVFTDKRDEHPIAMAFASRTFDSGMQYENYSAAIRYVESAETAAIGRALTAAGFNIAAIPPEEKEGELSEAPIKPLNNEGPTVNSSQNVQQEDSDRYSELIKPENGNMIQLPDGLQMQQEVFDFSGEEDTGESRNVSKNTQLEEMTMQDASKVIVPFGVNKGKSLGEIALTGAKGIRDIEWIANTYNGDDLRLKHAAKMLLNAAD